jgi:hypothetical protein
MAFKFLGDPKAYGKPVIKVRVKCSNGVVHEYLPQDTVEFQINEQIIHSCPDGEQCRCWRALRVDTRFQEI